MKQESLNEKSLNKFAFCTEVYKKTSGLLIREEKKMVFEIVERSSRR